MKAINTARWAICIAVMGALSARAEFRVEGADDRVSQQTAAVAPPMPRPQIPVATTAQDNVLFGVNMKRSSVTQVGAPATPPSTLQGFGRELPFVMAMKQVVPQGWRGFTIGAVDTSRIVSWKGGGRTWVAIVEDISEQAGVVAQIDWNRQEISFYATADLNAAAGGAAANKKTTWELRAGKSLQENLEGWAREAGWKLVWRPDFKFMIAADVTLNGAFEGDDGVVARVTSAYRNSENPIIPEFFLANRVVEIRELSNNLR